MKNLHYISILFIVSVLLIPSFLYSQKLANNWLFANFGLEFKYDTIVIRQDYAPHENRGMGIISDQNGDLLFYTDGFNVWNRNHVLMPNGANLYSPVGSPLLQESIIIPKPGSTTIYYIFTVDPYNGQSASGLYCSTVDLSIDNGLGDVIIKGQKLINQTTNKITAVLHYNKKDIWLITQQYSSNNYNSYLISDTGISQSPIVSSVGKTLTSSYSGQLKASPDGSKIACSYDDSYNAEGFELFDFNNITGKLTNPLVFKFPISYRGCDGMEFSSDATKLFVYQSGSTGESGLYQFELSGQTYDKINSSRILVFRDMLNTLEHMQLAPNGKIYFTKGGGQSSGTEYLGVINNPNEWGNGCNVKELGLYLNGLSTSSRITPNFIQNYFFKTSFIFSNACSGNLTDFQITNENGIDSVKWDFGQDSVSILREPQIAYRLPGEYIVTLFAYYPTKTDTIQKKITVNPSPVLDLGRDTTVCYDYLLSVAAGFKSYHWNTGDSTQSIIVKKSGIYRLTVENEFGCQTTDSINLNILALPVIDLPDSIQLGTLDSIPVYAGNFDSYLWNTGETTSTIYIKKEGWYSVTVKNEAGCDFTKSFYVYINKQSIEDPNDWKLLNPQPTAFNALDINFLNNQIGYILNQNQILSTSDGGNTWKVLTNISNGKLMAFKNNYGYIIGSSGAIYKSTYMGAGWNKLSPPFTDNLTGISVISKDTVIVTGINKLYSSFDGGEHWNTSNITNYTITSSCFTSSVVGHVGCTNGSVFKTVDGGKTWSLKSSINTTSSNINKLYFADANTGFISRGYMTEILKTTDAGETWKTIQSTFDEIYSFHFLDPLNGFCAGEYGVIFKTTDGGITWSWLGFQNGRYDATDINSLFFIDNMTGFAVGMSGRIIKTTDGGKTWKEYAPTYNAIKQLKFISDTITYGLVGNSFIKSIDGCKSWTNIGAPIPTGNTNQFDFIDKNIGYCIAGGSIGSSATVAKVYKTTDGGKTWIATYGGQDIIYDNLYSICFTDDKTGFVSGGNTTFRTTDGGATWTKVNAYSFIQMKFLSPLVGYGKSYNQIYKTTNGGTIWSALSSPVGISGIASFEFITENTGYIVGSSSSELYKTVDGGVTWQKITVPYGYYINVKFYSPNVGYITDDYGKTYQTSNGGISWAPFTKPYSVKNMELFDGEIYAFGGSGIIMKKKVDFQPAVLVVNPASSITNNSVTLSGYITSNNQLIKNIKFEYGTGVLTDKVEVQPDSIQANTTLSTSINLKDLKPNQIYKFRITAEVEKNQYSSDILQFTTLPDYALYMNYGFNIGSNDADLNGIVVSNSTDISDIQFQYGTDTTFTYTAAANPAHIFPNIGVNQIVSTHIDSLKPLTRYYVRIKANYKGTSVYSSINSFTTLSTYLINIYNPYISGNNANFNIYINANKDTIRNIEFEYGTSRNYENKITIPTQIVKGSYSYLSTQLTGLDSATIYYYRIKANMGNEIIYSNENTLKLKKDVIMIPIEIKQISDSSVQLQGLINANGSYLYNIKFHYGLSENLSDSIFATPYYISGYSTILASSTLFHLIPDIKYYAVLSASNGTSTMFSESFSFKLSSSGLDSLTNNSDVIIYPNPANNYLMINSIKTVDKVELTDFTGRVLITSTNKTKIDISLLQTGVYLIRIYMGDKVHTKKLLKN